MYKHIYNYIFILRSIHHARHRCICRTWRPASGLVPSGPPFCKRVAFFAATTRRTCAYCTTAKYFSLPRNYSDKLHRRFCLGCAECCSVVRSSHADSATHGLCQDRIDVVDNNIIGRTPGQNSVWIAILAQFIRCGHDATVLHELATRKLQRDLYPRHRVPNDGATASSSRPSMPGCIEPRPRVEYHYCGRTIDIVSFGINGGKSKSLLVK